MKNNKDECIFNTQENKSEPELFFQPTEDLIFGKQLKSVVHSIQDIGPQHYETDRNSYFR